jgi:hypothetical protein
MDDCQGEGVPILPVPDTAIPGVAVPGFVEPVSSDFFENCPCVSLHGSPGFVALGGSSPDMGGDYNLGFVS